jgi:hypothetical protein
LACPISLFFVCVHAVDSLMNGDRRMNTRRNSDPDLDLAQPDYDAFEDLKEIRTSTTKAIMLTVMRTSFPRLALFGVLGVLYVGTREIAQLGGGADRQRIIGIHILALIAAVFAVIMTWMVGTRHDKRDDSKPVEDAQDVKHETRPAEPADDTESAPKDRSPPGSD